MLKTLFGNKTAAYVLAYLARYPRAHPSVIARELAIPVNMVQKQLVRFEQGQLLRSHQEGRRRVYEWNRAHPFHRDLRRLLTKVDAVPLPDPADVRHLTLAERVQFVEDLTRDSERLLPGRRYQPFVQTFPSFKHYAAWKKTQRSPWLL